MSWFVLIKIIASVVTGIPGISLGMLPSILLFRDVANGVVGRDGLWAVLWSGQ